MKTNNKQQTAVEWLFAELKNHLDIPSHHANEILEQAKEMEKQQAINLYYEYEIYSMITESNVMTFEQYYEQTYGGGEQ